MAPDLVAPVRAGIGRAAPSLVARREAGLRRVALRLATLLKAARHRAAHAAVSHTGLIDRSLGQSSPKRRPSYS
jgi:hypothetical protein